MIEIRKSQERGWANHGWLKSAHTFSFANYYDPNYMGFRSLRVINEDIIQPAQGFGTHPHRNMEIITYVLKGALQHKDSMGNGSIIQAGDVQKMSAGTGIAHSEYNPSSTEPVHLFQIWIVPNQNNLTPSYEQKNYSQKEKTNRLCLIASPQQNPDLITIHQDVNLYASLLEAGKTLTHKFAPNRHGWLHLVRGKLQLNQQPLNTGDSAAIIEEKSITIVAQDAVEFLLFDLA